MNIFPLCLTAAIALSAIGCTQTSAPASNAVTSIEYRGKMIPTAKAYEDLDSFKQDSPAHLSEAAFVQIEQAMVTAAFGPTFRNQAALDNALDQLRFPGYGSFYANQLGAKLDASLEFLYVEVPQRSKNRYFALQRNADGKFAVVADFVGPATPEIVRVRRASDGALEFLSADGTLITRRTAA
jgi:hypothetical protein